MTKMERAELLSRACPYWFALDRKTKDDLIDGKCTYSEYENVPIIDYTKPHAVFSEMA